MTSDELTDRCEELVKEISDLKAKIIDLESRLTGCRSVARMAILKLQVLAAQPVPNHLKLRSVIDSLRRI